MKTRRSNLITSLIERKAKCKFISICSLYSNSSYTCTHVGGEYCGKYRSLTVQPQNGITFEVKEELVAE